MDEKMKKCEFCGEEVLSLATKCKHCESDLGAKKCKFCGEEILSIAIKCKHCGSDLDKFQETDVLTNNAVNNNIVWLLAFAPLIGAFIEGFLSGATEMSIDTFWWVTLVLNIGLGVMDENILKKAGHDVSEMGGGWLVPVYLFKRAKILKQNNAYFIVWCVLFGLYFLQGLVYAEL